MELSAEQQIFDQITKSERVLIALPEVLNADVVGSALALKLFIQKLEKQAEVVSSGSVPPQFSFLPGADSITHAVGASKSMVVVIDTSKKELEEISYHTDEGKAFIFLKPKNEQFVPEDVSFTSDKMPYDLVVLLGCQSLESLGLLFEQNPDVFYETPKVNIDCSAANEYYGAVNFVDISATSVAEVLANLFEKFETQMVDEHIATALLTGIISRTNSFQHSQTTPRVFLKASELIGLGGRQQEVIKHLYKTKPLPLLRLWGRALARLKMEDDLSVLYSMLNLSDFGKAGASDSDLVQVLKELLDNVSSYRVVALMSESLGGGVRMLLAMHASIPSEAILEKLGTEAKPIQAVADPFKAFDITLPNTTLQDTETRFLEAVKDLHV